ncbi:MAG: ATP-binding cassette, subfamily bacterial [Actinomycetota bacterium]|nr:ATP-binding cassette, subfamily bacterial [Actinomycetota bacterium]
MSDADHGDEHRDVVRRGLRVVWTGIRAEPRVFALSVLGSALYGAGTAGAGWVLGLVTEAVLTPAFAAGRVGAGEIAKASGALLGVAVVTSVGVVVRRAAAGITMYRLQASYRRRITRQYLRLPLAWHHRHPAGQLLSTANADVEATWQVFAPLPMSLGVLVMLAVGTAAMLAADPVLAAVGMLVLPALTAANAVYQRSVSPLVARAQALRGEVSSVAHESFDGTLVVKTLGREDAETERFARAARSLRDANVAVGRTRGVFDPLIEALPVLGTLAVLAIGAARVAAGDARTADVVQVAYVLSLLAFPVRALGWVLGELPRSVVGWERMAVVLDARGELSTGPETLPGSRAGTRSGPAALAVEDAGYAHTGEDGEPVPVLHDVALDVAPGRTVAVVGPTGSGKSTLAGMLVRLVDPATGRVLLDGVDVRRLRVGEVPGAAALVPQSTFVFDDTVRGNVTLGADVDDDAVRRALRRARADRFVAALPDGLDTRVGERGASLSGGQRQRIALARALVRSPRLLVLDDATSAVDPRVEAQILRGLRAGSGTTVLVIANRLATIGLADEVVYLDGGTVAARGTHDELLVTSPGYRDLVTAYARDAKARERSGGPAGQKPAGTAPPGGTEDVA